MTTLISFLGKQRSGYRNATYCFTVGDRITTPFFGLALLQYIRPDRLILMGTAGSMWDVFFMNEGESGNDDALLELMEATTAGQVTPVMLEQHAERLSEKLGLPVDCQLISFARDTVEQTAILADLADSLQDGEEIILDVTHAFRHLPMLALVAARYLMHVRQVTVSDIYYGALEMTEADHTPVLQLGGMLKMLDWVDALAIHDHDGSYRQFADLIDKPEIANPLRNAQFDEQIGRIGQARKPLKSVTKALQAEKGNDPLLRLFSPQLAERIAWAEGDRYGDRQAGLAKRCLQTHQYARAIEMGFEAFISRLTQNQGSLPESYENRKRAQDAFEADRPGSLWDDYKQLRQLRNAVAHGTRPDIKATQQALESEEALKTHVEQLFKKLLG